MSRGDAPKVPDLVLGPDHDVVVSLPARRQREPWRPSEQFRRALSFGVAGAIALVVACVALVQVVDRPSPGSTLLVADFGSNELVTVQTGTGAIRAVARVPQPNVLAVAPNGAYAIVASGHDAVVVVNLRTTAVQARITIGSEATAIATMPTGATGAKAYVVSPLSLALTPVDLGSKPGAAASALHTKAFPLGIAVSPSGTDVYVTDYEHNLVMVIDLATRRVVRAIPVGAGPSAIAVTPDGARAYVVDATSGEVTPIDLRSGHSLPPIRTGAHVAQIAITPNGSMALVSDLLHNTVIPIELRTGTVLAAVKVGMGPGPIAVSPDGVTAYVSDFGSDTVTPINLRTLKAGTPIPAGREPAGLAVERT